MTKKNELEQLLTTQEAADILRIHRIRLYQLINEGYLSAVKIGNRSYRIKPSDLKEYIEKQTRHSF